MNELFDALLVSGYVYYYGCDQWEKKLNDRGDKRVIKIIDQRTIEFTDSLTGMRFFAGPAHMAKLLLS